MTYTESNYSFIKSILEPYFREAGIVMGEVELRDIVLEISKNNNQSTVSSVNGHDYIIQKALEIIKG